MRVLLVVYDNDAYIHWFPQGLAYIAAVLEQGRSDVRFRASYNHFSAKAV